MRSDEFNSIRSIETDVIAAMERGLDTAKMTGNRGALIDETFAGKYLFPLKIVFELE